MTAKPRFAALHHGAFRALWLGLIVSNVGTWMQNVAQSWWIYRTTGNDPLFLGLLGVSFAVPMTLVPPIGGAVADRVDRVRLLFVTQSTAMLTAATLAALAFSGRLLPWHVLTASFVGALLLAFDNPTRQALVPDLVAKEDLANALSLNSMTFTGAALVGPALAGALLGPLGVGWLFALNAASYGAVLAVLPRLRAHAARAVPRSSFREAVLGGVRYVARAPAVRRWLVLSAAAAILARSYTQLLPVFAADVWHAGPSAYGALLSAGGAGAVLGGAGLAARRDVARVPELVRASGVVLAVSLVVFARAPWLSLGTAMLVVVGIAATVFTTLIATEIQLTVPPALRGRVMGLYTITLIGLPALGSMGTAALARALRSRGDAAGAPDAVTAFGLVLLVLVALLARVPRAGTDERAAG